MGYLVSKVSSECFITDLSGLWSQLIQSTCQFFGFQQRLNLFCNLYVTRKACQSCPGLKWNSLLMIAVHELTLKWTRKARPWTLPIHSLFSQQLLINLTLSCDSYRFPTFLKNNNFQIRFQSEFSIFLNHQCHQWVEVTSFSYHSCTPRKTIRLTSLMLNQKLWIPKFCQL